MRSSFYCHPLFFSFGDRFTNAHEQVLIGSACVSVGRAGCGWKRTESWGLVQRLFWLVWQYERLKATQWPILLSSSFFSWRTTSIKWGLDAGALGVWGMCKYWTVLYAAHCRSAHVHSPFVFLCHMCFGFILFLFYFLKVRSLLYPSPAGSLLECLAFLFIHYCILPCKIFITLDKLLSCYYITYLTVTLLISRHCNLFVMYIVRLYSMLI